MFGVIPRYYETTKVVDASGKTATTFFDYSMAQLVDESCENLIKGYADLTDCPTPVEKNKGLRILFRLQQHKDNNKCENTSVVTRDFEPPTVPLAIEASNTQLLPAMPAKEQEKKISHPNTSCNIL